MYSANTIDAYEWLRVYLWKKFKTLQAIMWSHKYVWKTSMHQSVQEIRDHDRVAYYKATSAKLKNLLTKNEPQAILLPD